jgi:hypothetical protein
MSNIAKLAGHNDVRFEGLEGCDQLKENFEWPGWVGDPGDRHLLLPEDIFIEPALREVKDPGIDFVGAQGAGQVNELLFRASAPQAGGDEGNLQRV